jgi:hypothetical protein
MSSFHNQDPRPVVGGGDGEGCELYMKAGECMNMGCLEIGMLLSRYRMRNENDTKYS